MRRRQFLVIAAAAGVTKRKANLDKLISDYNRRFEAVSNVGQDTVCYDRETWDGIREAFGKIMEACSNEK